jgi:hypothetical protein
MPRSQFAAGFRLELADAQIGIAGFEQACTHAGDTDHFTRDAEFTRCIGAFALDGQADLAARLAAQHVDGTGQVVGLHRNLIDAQDDVTGLDAGTRRRRIVDGRDHAQGSIHRGHLDAESRVTARGVLGQIREGIALQVFAVRIKANQHAADRGLHELVIVDRLDIGLFDQAEHGGEQANVIQAYVARGRGSRCRRRRRIGWGRGIGRGSRRQRIFGAGRVDPGRIGQEQDQDREKATQHQSDLKRNAAIIVRITGFRSHRELEQPHAFEARQY